MQIDVELALVNATVSELKYFQDNLPGGFYVEDKSDRNWGLVIRTTQKLPEDFTAAIDDFLGAISSLVELINNYDRVLRVGIFYETATCTIQLNSYNQLLKFRMPIEISVYPSTDEEQI